MLEDFVPEDEDVVVSCSTPQERIDDHGDKVSTLLCLISAV